MLAPRSPAALLGWSNFLTYAGLAAALCGLWGALVRRDAAMAGAAIATAVLCDTFDGAFARLFPRTAFERDFGGQLDSLADGVVSGVVPPLALLALSADPGKPFTSLLLWGGAFAWVLAAMTRLGYYNIAPEAGERFVGVPAPVAALVAATALLWPIGWMAAMTVMLLGAVAMVLPVSMARPRGPALLPFAAWALLVALRHMHAALR